MCTHHPPPHHCEGHPLVSPSDDFQEAWGAVSTNPSEDSDRRFQFLFRKKKSKKKDLLQPESCKNSLAFCGEGEGAGGGNLEAADREERENFTSCCSKSTKIFTSNPSFH